MKTLIPCIYCLVFFEDLEKSEVCESCTPKLFIDMALQSIEQGVIDLKEAKIVAPDHIKKRMSQIVNLKYELADL